MPTTTQSITTLLARLMLSTIFLLSALGNKIPNFSGVVKYMESAGVPAPHFLLVGAIVFLIVGSLSILLGYKARVGATLLLIFLALATYYFHPFWKLEGQAQQLQMIQFMKNLSIAGALLFIFANGPGPLSLDNRAAANSRSQTDEAPQTHRLQTTTN
jgi:putative oxidoreductase